MKKIPQQNYYESGMKNRFKNLNFALLAFQFENKKHTFFIILNCFKIMKNNLTYILFFLSSFTLSAQSYEFGIFAGVTTYQGDLADGLIVWPNIQPAGGLLLRYSPGSFYALRLNFTTGKLLGNDLNSKRQVIRDRGFSFYSTVREISTAVEFHLPSYGSSAYGLFKFKLSPYIFGGIGLSVINGEPKAPVDRLPYPFPEFDARKNFLVIPMGGGLKLRINNKFATCIEWGTRKTFGDYIDGISINGNPKSGDWYIFGGLTLTYVVDGGDDNPYRGRNH